MFRELLASPATSHLLLDALMVGDAGMGLRHRGDRGSINLSGIGPARNGTTDIEAGMVPGTTSGTGSGYETRQGGAWLHAGARVGPRKDTTKEREGR